VFGRIIVTRTKGYAALAISIIIAGLCAGLIVLRLQTTRSRLPLPQVEAKRETEGTPKPPTRPSTIIDLPGDPVLVRRGQVATPPKDVLIAVPAKLGQDAPKIVAKAHFLNSTLAPTTGGYMGKYQESGQQADVLAMQLAVNSQKPGDQTREQIEAGSDDDGGADTPADTESLILTSANSNQIEVNVAGSAGPPQLKETVLRTVVAQKLSALLIANGYAEESARMIELAAKGSSGRIDTLPAGSVALAVGALDLAGEYYVKQIAIFEDREYVVTVGAKDDGGYGEAAEPLIPPGLLEESVGPELAAIRFNVADGVYSAGLRSEAPEPVVREAIQLIRGLADLKSPLEADEAVRLLYESDFRDKAKSAGRVVYVGLRGGALTVDCYAFEGSDGYFRCFAPKAALPAPPSREGALASLGNSTTSVGGILAPIKGAPLTSLFGMRFHPILHILRLHAGLDFGAPIGSPVRAAADGTIEFAGEARGFGNHVRIQHAGFETSYSHLSEIPESIKPGVKVKEGDIVALSGNTGLSSGPHLHFEYYLGGEAVDPMPHFGTEIQSAAAALAGQTFTAAVAPAFAAATPAELQSFQAVKAYLDAKLAELLKSQ
jgi:murein DD-endopeptidase MepM/ murein hydrolase activator NlpD